MVIGAMVDIDSPEMPATLEYMRRAGPALDPPLEPMRIDLLNYG